jgi:hypothetical protein
MSNRRPNEPRVPWVAHELSEPLSDQLVEKFLDGVTADADRTSRVRRMFVQKLLTQLHPVPVRHVANPWSFGRWIEAIRQSVGLTRSDIALAIHDNTDFVERVERTDIAPWQLNTTSLADLVCLFRIHISAVEVLFARSAAVIHGHRTTAASARSVTNDLTRRGESARNALDRYLAAKASGSSAGAVPQVVIDGLTQELERRQALELLRTSE